MRTRKIVEAPVLGKSDGQVIPSRRGGGVSRFRRIPPGREARSLCSPSKQLSDQLYNTVNGLRNAFAHDAYAYFIMLKKQEDILLCVELLGTSEREIQKRFY